MVLNWVNFWFTNLVWGVHQTVMKLCLGPKIFAQHVPGIFAQFAESCLWMVDSKESSSVDEEERKGKMDDGIDTSLALEENYLFVDLWEPQPCLRGPQWYSS